MKTITLKFKDGEKHTQAERVWLKKVEDKMNTPKVLAQIDKEWMKLVKRSLK